MLLFGNMLQHVGWLSLVVAVVLLVGAVVTFVKLFQKVDQGTALVRNGLGGTKVSFSGMMVVPVLHRSERIDISVKRIEIYRHGESGLICMDNIRADIKVAFFVRVNKTTQDVMRVAQLLGCSRASEQKALVELFDAKFSEALKTVGKQFDFVDLYNSRDRFKDEILKTIGTDLNGYVLDDAAIDYLEQTPVETLNPDNILDAEGIKKITDLTARQMVLANEIRRDKEKTVTKQDVEAREAILELERQQAEAEEKQQREVREIQARERAEAAIMQQQQRQRAEQARIEAEEEIQIAEENKLRQVIVAQKSKLRTEAIETERVEKDRALEETERKRIVTLAEIEKEKAVELEKKNIQDVIRDRVMVQRAVVEEQEKIKDTQEYAAAERAKQVAVTAAEMEAERELVKEVKAAEAAKAAAVFRADEVIIEADATRAAAEKKTEAQKMLAEAITAKTAAEGLAEAQVLEAKASAKEKQGAADAVVLQRKAEAEARGLTAHAEAIERQGVAEAKAMQLKFEADAEGITQKAEAMKLFDGVGREHEEFKLRLEMQKEIELAAIEAQQKIAAEQAEIVGQGLKSARIDIVGGENDFFQKMISSIAGGKAVDRLVRNSSVLTDVTRTFFNGNPEYFQRKLEEFTARFGITTDDAKNLSIAALIARMMGQTKDGTIRQELQQLLSMAEQAGVSDSLIGKLQVPLPNGRGSTPSVNN
ncbi:MAG: flotillin family protein [Planctomycetota bacterium]